MNREDKLILGTLAGVDLVLSPEHYEEYKDTLNKQLEEKDKEIARLNNIISELEKVFIECDYQHLQMLKKFLSIFLNILIWIRGLLIIIVTILIFIILSFKLYNILWK